MVECTSTSKVWPIIQMKNLSIWPRGFTWGETLLMNIKTQCCGIILLLVLFEFYRHYRKVELNTGKVFGRIFFLTFCSIVLDTLSVVAIINKDILPLWLVELNCKSYLASLVAVVFCSVLYICADVYIQNRKLKKKVWILIVISLIEEAIIYFLPISYYYAEDTGIVYTHGPSVFMTYIFVFSFMLFNIYFMIHKKKEIDPRRRSVVFVWMAVWIAAATFQFFRNDILITGFASAIGVLVIYLRLENPEMLLERKTGFFNQNAFIEYTRQRHAENENCGMLWLFFERAYHQHLEKEVELAVDMGISRFLLGLPDVQIFKLAEDELVFLFSNEKTRDEVIDKIINRFEQGWGRESEVFLHPKGLYLGDVNKVADYKDLFYLFRYVRNSDNTFAEQDYRFVDDKLLSALYTEKKMEQLIFSAIENDRIEVYYQPIYSTKEHRFTCAEALMRMRDEAGNIIPPMAFISVAEKNGMIIQLGSIIFEKVCQFIKENGLAHFGMNYIEVNLSVVQCNYVNLAEDLIKIMEKYKVDPSYINLEITETASLSAKRILLDNMKSLVKYGVHFALDDFGTGQSNLNYIVDMPVDIVKFDRMMTNSYFENGKAKYVMDAAMQMIHGMNLKIVSEGIETKQQYDAMEHLGINYIQGFYFSKPLPKDQFIAFLEGKTAK